MLPEVMDSERSAAGHFVKAVQLFSSEQIPFSELQLRKTYYALCGMRVMTASNHAAGLHVPITTAESR